MKWDFGSRTVETRQAGTLLLIGVRTASGISVRIQRVLQRASSVRMEILVPIGLDQSP